MTEAEYKSDFNHTKIVLIRPHRRDMWVRFEALEKSPCYNGATW